MILIKDFIFVRIKGRIHAMLTRKESMPVIHGKLNMVNVNQDISGKLAVTKGFIKVGSFQGNFIMVVGNYQLDFMSLPLLQLLEVIAIVVIELLHAVAELQKMVQAREVLYSQMLKVYLLGSFLICYFFLIFHYFSVF